MFTIDFPIPVSDFNLDLGDKLVFLGSCFSEEISNKFRNAGFDVLSNPFGIIFHPTAIVQILSIEDFEYTVFERDGLWFSWVASTTIYSTTKEGLISLLIKQRNLLIGFLKEAQCIFITLGTAFEYRLIESNQLTANCHKMPSTLFDKKLTPLQELEAEWQQGIVKIKEYNPSIQIVFTISPVRHIRDGIIENNRSKARLFELVSGLLNNTSYFPSYEIVIDKLRDYRFYKSDGVHPNELAINYIWEKITKWVFSDDVIKVVKEVEKLRLLFAHRPIHPESISTQKMEQSKNQKLIQFLNQYPTVVW